MNEDRLKSALDFWYGGWRRFITIPLTIIAIPIICTGLVAYVGWQILKGFKH